MDDASLSVATDVCVCVAGVAIEDACSSLVVRVCERCRHICVCVCCTSVPERVRRMTMRC